MSKSLFEKLARQSSRSRKSDPKRALDDFEIKTAKVSKNDDDDDDDSKTENSDGSPSTETVEVEEKPRARKDILADESEGQLIVDVYQTPNEIVIKSTIAGVEPENLDIAITRDMVTIKGERVQDEEVAEADYFYQECYWGRFNRSIILPTEIEAEKAKAVLKNGILTVRLPKSEKDKVKKLKVERL